VDFFINEEEAREIRGKPMAERTAVQGEFNEALHSVHFRFCEH
jgi:hypothetical protein